MRYETASGLSKLKLYIRRGGDMDEPETIQIIYEYMKRSGYRDLSPLIFDATPGIWWYFKPPVPIDIEHPLVFAIMGYRNSGKSALAERIANTSLILGHRVYDLMSSLDGESLAWLRSKLILYYPYRVIIVKGGKAEITINHDNFKSNIEVVDATTIDDYIILREPDLLLTSPLLFPSDTDYFETIIKILSILRKRLSMAETRIASLVIREAHNVFYRHRENPIQKDLRRIMLRAIREARHMGITIIMDTQRHTSIEREARELSDFIILKRMNPNWVTEMGFGYIYRYVYPRFIATMTQSECLVLSYGMGNLAYARFAMPTWHKGDKENIHDVLKKVGVKIRIGDVRW